VIGARNGCFTQAFENLLNGTSQGARQLIARRANHSQRADWRSMNAKDRTGLPFHNTPSPVRSTLL